MTCDSTPGWYEIRDNHIFVWQGVCAIQSSSSIFLLKIGQDNRILKIFLSDLYRNYQMTSDGYWECVELTADLINSGSLYYHADCPHKASILLKHALVISSSSIINLTIRLDDDPLRLKNGEEKLKRLYSWLNVVTDFCDSPTVIIDRNMPL